VVGLAGHPELIAELGEDAKRNAAQIVGNVHAMQAVVALSERLDAESILELHHPLLQATEPGIAGRWRTGQVWIGGGGYSPHRAAFLPPHADRVPAAIGDLVALTACQDVPALPHAALAHSQFEAIHPFPGGNGRRGRALIPRAPAQARTDPLGHRPGLGRPPGRRPALLRRADGLPRGRPRPDRRRDVTGVVRRRPERSA